MNQSVKHHYLPVFYLRGFTLNGTFKIFDQQKGAFKKRGKLFTPSSHFYIINDNRVFLEGEFADFIEQSYGKTETDVSKIFEKITLGIRLSEKDVPYLQYFVAIIFWRLPANRPIVEHLGINRSLKDLGLSFRDNNTGEIVEHPELENKIKSDPEFMKWMRTILPFTFLKRFENCTTPIHILDFPELAPLLCTDNPIILRHPEQIDIYLDDFIFPLTGNKILVRIKTLVPYWSTIKVQIDILLVLMAKQYISCTSEEYLVGIRKSSEDYRNLLPAFRERIFKTLEGTLPVMV